MHTNADITIYNRKYDKATRLDVWHRMFIPGVHLHLNEKIVLLDTGITSASTVTVRIPADTGGMSGYLPAEAYSAAPDVSGMWTVQLDDYIAEGNGPEIKTPKDLGRGYKVTGFSDNRRGTVLQHLKIGGV